MKPSSPSLSQEHLKKLHEGLDKLSSLEASELLMDNFEFIRRFRISRRTAYNWRRKGLIPYVIIEDKVFYKPSEIRKFIERNERREGEEAGRPKTEDEEETGT